MTYPFTIVRNPANGKITVWMDPSSIKEGGCILRLYNILVAGLKGGKNANDIEFGSAFHAYRKEYEVMMHNKEFVAGFGNEAKTIAKLKGINAAVNYWQKTPMFTKYNKKFLDEKYLIQTCNGYHDHYAKMGEEYSTVTIADEPLVELRIPYPYYTTPEGDVEVILCGTVDRIVKHKTFGYYAINDYKTTSVWDKQKYFDFYRMSPQMIAYKLLVKLYAQKYPKSVIAEIDRSDVKFVIDGVFVAASGPATFEQSAPISFNERQLKEFKEGLDLLISKLIHYIRFPENLFREGMLNGSCEKIYGACNFFNVCSASSDEEAHFALENGFQVGSYDPMSHGELKPEIPSTQL